MHIIAKNKKNTKFIISKLMDYRYSHILMFPQNVCTHNGWQTNTISISLIEGKYFSL